MKYTPEEAERLLSNVEQMADKARDSRAAYCYELSAHMMTGKHPTERVTPENLLRIAIDMKTN